MKLVRWCRLQWDRVSAVVLFVAGALTLLVGWAGTSRTVFPAEQIPYLASGAAGGLFLLGLGATFWLSADLRDEWHKIDRLEQRLFPEKQDDVTLDATPEIDQPSADGDGDAPSGLLVTSRRRGT